LAAALVQPGNSPSIDSTGVENQVARVLGGVDVYNRLPQIVVRQRAEAVGGDQKRNRTNRRLPQVVAVFRLNSVPNDVIVTWDFQVAEVIPLSIDLVHWPKGLVSFVEFIGFIVFSDATDRVQSPFRAMKLALARMARR
jgi:hypothetical protein